MSIAIGGVSEFVQKFSDPPRKEENIVLDLVDLVDEIWLTKSG